MHDRARGQWSAVTAMSAGDRTGGQYCSVTPLAGRALKSLGPPGAKEVINTGCFIWKHCSEVSFTLRKLSCLRNIHTDILLKNWLTYPLRSQTSAQIMPENIPLLFDMMGHTGLKTYIILNVHSFFIPYKSIFFMDTSRKKRNGYNAKLDNQANRIEEFYLINN